MALTKDQEALLRQKIAEGAALGDIQAALQKAGAQMTYMELRFLLDDLGLTVQDKPPKAPEAPPAQAYDQMPDTAAGGVKVTLDTVVRAGTLMSGSVTFTDGMTAQWSLNDSGRIGLSGVPKGYQPPQADLADFQTQLRQTIESRGGI